MRPGDGRIVPTFACQALRGLPLTVAGDGSQTRSLCHVDDTVRGILAVARSDLAGPVNIGNPDEATVAADRRADHRAGWVLLRYRVHPPAGRRPDGPVP